jgi:hypothetical protein
LDCKNTGDVIVNTGAVAAKRLAAHTTAERRTNAARHHMENLRE